MEEPGERDFGAVWRRGVWRRPGRPHHRRRGTDGAGSIELAGLTAPGRQTKALPDRLGGGEAFRPNGQAKPADYCCISARDRLFEWYRTRRRSKPSPARAAPRMAML